MYPLNRARVKFWKLQADAQTGLLVRCKPWADPEGDTGVPDTPMKIHR